MTGLLTPMIFCRRDSFSESGAGDIASGLSELDLTVSWASLKYRS